MLQTHGTHPIRSTDHDSLRLVSRVSDGDLRHEAAQVLSVQLHEMPEGL